MSGKSVKIKTALRFNKELLNLIKEKAKAEKRSLNNYIEYLLYKDVGNIPNEEIIKAIEKFNVQGYLEEIQNVDQFMDSL